MLFRSGLRRSSGRIPDVCSAHSGVRKAPSEGFYRSQVIPYKGYQGRAGPAEGPTVGGEPSDNNMDGNLENRKLIFWV